MCLKSPRVKVIKVNKSNSHQSSNISSTLNPSKTFVATDSLFTFDAGPENVIEQPVNEHPFNTIVDTPLPTQVSKLETSFTDDLAMSTLDVDISPEAQVSGFDITVEISASCDSDVRSY